MSQVYIQEKHNNKVKDNLKENYQDQQQINYHNLNLEENTVFDLIDMSTSETHHDNNVNNNYYHNSTSNHNNKEINMHNKTNQYTKCILNQNLSNDKKINQQVKYFEVFLIIFISLFYLILKHDTFLRFGFIFGLAINIFKCKDILDMLNFYNYLITICIIFILYYLIIDYNPFYYFILYWLPFQNLFRVIIFTKVLNVTINKKINLIIESEEENQVRLKRNTLFYINSKRYLIVVMLLLLILRLSIWLIDDNFSQYFQSIPNKKYFICANLYNSEIILDDWTKQVLRLTDHIGKDNVYISVFENGDSNDTTRSKLNKFQEDLISKQINNTINTTKYYYKQNYTRIPFLALVRNGALNPLHSLGWDLNNTQVIFLNDIIFDYQDILKLIFTNNNDYDMACGMDFYDHFYDTWISLSISSEYTENFFPFYFDKRNQRRVINGDPFRVFCCWNGVASIKGSVLKDIKFRAHKNGDDSSECSLL